jgi:hypothetical protein
MHVMAVTKRSIQGSEKSVPADTKTIKKAPAISAEALGR